MEYCNIEHIYINDPKSYLDQTPIFKRTLDMDFIIQSKAMVRRGSMCSTELMPKNRKYLITKTLQRLIESKKKQRGKSNHSASNPQLNYGQISNTFELSPRESNSTFLTQQSHQSIANRSNTSIGEFPRAQGSTNLNKQISDLQSKLNSIIMLDKTPFKNKDSGLALKIKNKIGSKVSLAHPGIYNSDIHLKNNVDRMKFYPTHKHVNTEIALDDSTVIANKTENDNNVKHIIDNNDQQQINKLLAKYTRIYAAKSKSLEYTLEGEEELRKQNNSFIRVIDTKLLIRRKKEILNFLSSK